MSTARDRLDRALVALRLEVPGSIVDGLSEIITQALDAAREDGYSAGYTKGWTTMAANLGKEEKNEPHRSTSTKGS